MTLPSDFRDLNNYYNIADANRINFDFKASTQKHKCLYPVDKKFVVVYINGYSSRGVSMSIRLCSTTIQKKW